MIPGPERLLQALASAGGTIADMLWVMDETSINNHLLQRAATGVRPEAALTADAITERSDGVAIVSIDGVMTKHAHYRGEVSTLVIASAVAAAAADDAVSSIVLRINSPGGHAFGLIELAEAINAAKAKKPIVAHSSGLIASAAYWTASQCTKIYAEQMHLIGSIGTRIMAYEFKGLMDNLGIRAIPIDTGPFKSTGAFGTEITAEQVGYIKTIVDDCQAHFTAAVQSGRGFTAEQFAAVADGRVFPVAEALRLGLIDGVQKFEATLAAMPRREASAQPKQRSKAMTQIADDAPKAATLKELKAAMPEASSDFIIEQQEKEATIGDALKAYNSHLAAKLKESEEARTAAEGRAKTAEEKTKATTTTEQPKARGHQFGASAGAAQADPAGEPDADYHAMALAYQKKHNCRWNEATLAIKKRYPESRAFFGAPKG